MFKRSGGTAIQTWQDRDRRSLGEKPFVGPTKRVVVRNAILAGLPHDEFEAVRPLLVRTPFRERTVLQYQNRPIEFVSFVESGIVSQRTLAAGYPMETALIGFYGVVGASIALGIDYPAHQSVAVTPCNVLRIGAGDLKRAMLELPQLRVRVLQHVQALLVHSSQVALCGVRHRLEERLACWLCLACRAGQSSVVPITHEDLSTILGMRRAGITEVLTRFERDGLIVKTRGALQVRDLHRLEQRACCCRRIICEAHR